jgi:hypothetical protein
MNDKEEIKAFIRDNYSKIAQRSSQGVAAAAVAAATVR